MRDPFELRITEAPPIHNVVTYELEMTGKSTTSPTGNVSPFVDPNVKRDNDGVAQAGVRKVEAITAVLNRNHLIAVYILMWLITFVDAMQQGVASALTPYVTSSFSKHSLTAYTGVMSGIIGGVLKLPLAKILDIFGRPQGFAISVGFLVLGLLLMAACTSVHVYAAAQIFYWLGYNSMYYTIGVFIADTSSLKNRGFMFAYVNSPYIVTAWIAGPLSTKFLHGPGWRWCFGVFAIITLVFSVPLFGMFLWNYRKAVSNGIIARVHHRFTFRQAIRYYVIEFDAGGLLLVMGGLVFLLLPFNLHTYQPMGWESPMIISFLVLGVVMLIAFVLYERYLAPKTFMPYRFLLDRTVMGTLILAMAIFVSFTIWNTYFSSFLQVVNGLSLADAIYITNIYTIGSCLFSLVVGIAIQVSGRFKWIAAWFGVPLTGLGVGLMIFLRQPNQPISYTIMCQLLVAFAGGAIVTTQQIAIMAATEHQHVAVVLALEGMASSVGGGIGSSIAAAIWTDVFPEQLAKNLPESSINEYPKIYGSLETQLTYQKGTPVREAIEKSYGDTHRIMCIVSASVLFIALAAVLMWRDIRVKDFRPSNHPAA